jgi:tripartite-type tricarboxylate transporter receptor subunit TctC
MFSKVVSWIAATAALVLAATAPASAQTFPAKPVRIVVTFPPGGATDLTARFFAEQLTKKTGQQFLVENVAGANGAIGTGQVVRAAADGYTLLMGGTGLLVVNPNLFPNVGYTHEDFTPVSFLAELQFVLVAKKDLGVRTAAELVALSKSRPGKLNYGSAGIGNTQHHAGVLFNSKTGADLTHIPYNGGAEAIKAILAGEVDVLFGTYTETASNIKAGNLVPLASLGKRRISQLPDVPTLRELGITDAEVSSWYGLYAPKGTPVEVSNTVNKHVNEILKTPEAAQALGQLGLGINPAVSTPADMDALLRSDMPRWLDIIQLAGGPMK